MAVSEVRRSRGLTQADLAERTGIQRSYVASLESGRTNRLIEHLLRTLRRLGADVTVSWSIEPDAEGEHGEVTGPEVAGG
ncbi:MAG: helix-turn-helix transcriptional regulator [Actinobacteria bacterium]|nr:helix-turn-helix transcriptional regulator [Actinomycetota bacterium]